MDVCSSLGIIRFVEELPHGFNTYIGENGTTLSGGQRQLIAIARALYRDPEVLIMDEATSSLDSVAENNVKRAVEYLRAKGKTVIVIAHRLSTINIADRIFVIEKGRVVQEGRHGELASCDGPFRNMLRHQSLGIGEPVTM